MNKPYYNICPDCGCNLDPGERCSCKGEITLFNGSTPNQNSDVLIIDFDKPTSEDSACLSIFRKEGEIRCVCGEEATPKI